MAKWQNNQITAGGPGVGLEAVTLDATDNEGFVLYVETAGDVVATCLDGSEPGAVAVGDFSYYPAVVRSVATTGTTAAGLWKVKVA